MNLKSKIMGAVVLAAVVGGISSAEAATSITLNVAYVGSTTGVTGGTAAVAASKVAQNTGTGLTLSTANTQGGSLATAAAGMTQYTSTQLASSAIQGIAGLKNYFAVYVDYVPNSVDDRLYGVGFNVNVPAGMVPVSSSGLQNLTTQKFIFWNPIDTNSTVGTWDQFGDLGASAGDLQGVGIFQDTADNAYAMAVGTPANTVAAGDDSGYIAGKGTLLGLFALQFTSTSVTQGTVSVTGTSGDARWFTADLDSSTSASDAALHVNGFTFSGGAAVPEPASLGVLALGGLALIARRRK